MLRWGSGGARARVALVLGAGLALLTVGGNVAASPDPAGGTTSRVSVGSGGVQANGDSGGRPAVSADGRFVAFQTSASNLVAGDTNGIPDVVVRDLVTQATRRVSVGPGGAQANGNSNGPAVSAHGRYVAFSSFASNLVAGDTNDTSDVFVRDLVKNVTRRVSVGPGGTQANRYSDSPAVSADGRYVAFSSFASNLVARDANNAQDVFVRDRKTHVTRRLSVGPGGVEADGFSENPAFSADGRYVAFASTAANLVAGDANNAQDVFVRDRSARVTTRISVGAGVEGDDFSYDPAVSAHGRYVAFTSFATNLVTGDTNGAFDVFVRDRRTNLTRRVSVGPGGTQANDSSFAPAISAGGSYVAFYSWASNLVTGDTNDSVDVFVRGRWADVARRVSVGPAGIQANDSSFAPAISSGGAYVAFYSWASNLVTRDTNDTADVFARTSVR